MEIKKVALIIPEFSGGFRLESIPLNLSYLGAVLKQHGFSPVGYNLNFEKLENSEIKKYQCFGISSPTAVFPEASRLAKQLKKINPKAIVVFGGPHATACPEECLAVREIDYVVVGEVEIAFPALLDNLNNKKLLNSVPNLVYRSKKMICKTKKETMASLDDIPFPAKDIFRADIYPDPQKAYGDIIASRGCPFKCANCKPGLDHIAPYRLRRPERVVDEMVWLKKTYGVKHFTFSDSELIGPSIWVEKFTREIIKRKLKITYSCNGRTDQVNRKILQLLKRSGCIFIGFGVESGSQEVLDNILMKGISLTQTKKIILETNQSGIGTGAWFMIGIPGETETQVKKTVAYAKKLSVSIIEVNIATPWPDTGFYYTCKENHWLLTGNWEKMNEKNFVAIETPYLKAQKVNELFNYFRQELIKEGWRMDSTQTRFYHRNFLMRTIVSSFGAVMHRGLQKGDFIKLKNWFTKRY